MRKTNPTPETYVAVCSGPRCRTTIDLNVHLRNHQIDSRYSGDDPERALLRVPPDKARQAGKLVVSYIHQHPDAGLQELLA